MNPNSFRTGITEHRQSVPRLRLFAVIATALIISVFGSARRVAFGEPVGIPGAEIPGWGQVDEVFAQFVRPEGTATKVPAVLILHGSGGMDARGAFYATALREAGIATLEIRMFQFGGRPKEGPQATMPHAIAALRWLGKQPDIDGKRLGVMGFSWGGMMTVLLSSELVQECLGKDVPRPVAFAPLYPACSNIARSVKNPKSAYYNAQTWMSTSPMLIHVGTKDDYEEGKHSCDALIATWPAAAREQVTVHYVEGATHAFDYQGPARQFFDPFAHGGRGGMVSIVPSPDNANETRKAVISFFVKHLNSNR